MRTHSLFWWLVRLLQLGRRKKQQLFHATPTAFFFFPHYLFWNTVWQPVWAQYPFPTLPFTQQNVRKMLFKYYYSALLYDEHCMMLRSTEKQRLCPLNLNCFSDTKIHSAKGIYVAPDLQPLSHCIPYDTHKNLTSVGYTGFASTYYSKQYNSLHFLFKSTGTMLHQLQTQISLKCLY